MKRRMYRREGNASRWKALSILLFVCMMLMILHYAVFNKVEEHTVNTVTEYVTVRDTVFLHDTVFVRPAVVKREAVENDSTELWKE